MRGRTCKYFLTVELRTALIFLTQKIAFLVKLSFCLHKAPARDNHVLCTVPYFNVYETGNKYSCFLPVFWPSTFLVLLKDTVQDQDNYLLGENNVIFWHYLE
jgi:hypothetical protein